MEMSQSKATAKAISGRALSSLSKKVEKLGVFHFSMSVKKGRRELGTTLPLSLRRVSECHGLPPTYLILLFLSCI